MTDTPGEFVTVRLPLEVAEAMAALLVRDVPDRHILSDDEHEAVIAVRRAIAKTKAATAPIIEAGS